MTRWRGAALVLVLMLAAGGGWLAVRLRPPSGLARSSDSRYGAPPRGTCNSPPASAASPTGTVDPGARQLTFRGPMVSFRSRLDGWAADLDGLLFRTSDGGLSWREARTEETPIAQSGDLAANYRFFRWLSPTAGLASTRDAAWSFQTADDGRSVTSARVTGLGEIRDATCAGRTCWACDSRGQLSRSPDSGSTWNNVPTGPPGKRDQCGGLSFLGDQDGWLVGGEGSVNETTDGGATWRELPGPGGPLDGVLRLSRAVAWVWRADHAYRTDDGGARWTPLAPQPDNVEPVVRRSRVEVGGVVREVFCDRPIADPVADVPLVKRVFGQSARPWGDDGALLVNEWGLIRYFACGQLVRALPVVSAGTNARVQPEGRGARPPSSRWGWIGHDIFRSEDGGRSWFGYGQQPAWPRGLKTAIARLEPEARSAMARDQEWPLRALAFVNDSEAVARTRDGVIVSAERPGAQWIRSPRTVLDEWELERVAAVAAGHAAPPHPLACLKDATEGVILVELDMVGCGGEPPEGGSVKVRWNAQEATVSGSHGCSSGAGPCRGGTTSLAADAAHALLTDLVAAAMGPESHTACSEPSESTLVADVSWACGSTRPGSPERLLSRCKSFAWPEVAYSRAHALRALVAQIASEHWKVQEPTR